jgi:hypothetical protein
MSFLQVGYEPRDGSLIKVAGRTIVGLRSPIHVGQEPFEGGFMPAASLDAASTSRPDWMKARQRLTVGPLGTAAPTELEVAPGEDRVVEPIATAREPIFEKGERGYLEPPAGPEPTRTRETPTELEGGLETPISTEEPSEGESWASFAPEGGHGLFW